MRLDSRENLFSKRRSTREVITLTEPKRNLIAREPKVRGDDAQAIRILNGHIQNRATIATCRTLVAHRFQIARCRAAAVFE